MISKLILRFRIFLSLLIIICFGSSVFSSSVFAVTVGISTPSASIDQGQDLDLDVFLFCINCGDSYLRGVFFETGDNYFGLTQNNNGDWIGTSSDRTKYFKVAKEELINNSWSGKLKFKIDMDNSYYKGSGNYSVKVGRYTSSSGSSATWSDSYFVNVVGPTSTPTPTPTPTSTPTPTFTPTPTPTNSPTPTSTPTPSLKSSTSPTSSPKITASPKILVASTSSVLGESAASTAGAVISPKPKAQAIKSSKAQNLLTPVLLILGALAVLGTGLSLFWLKRGKMYNE